MLAIRSRLAWVIMLMVVVGPGCATGRHDATSPQGQWLAEDIGGRGVIDNPPTTLDIAADGVVSGSGGCNRYSGKAEIDGSAIAIGPVAATKMACLHAPMDQETRFFDALDRARSWKIESDVLLLLDAQGNVLVRLAPVQPGASS
jgi:putative lipoprotein